MSVTKNPSKTELSLHLAVAESKLRDANEHIKELLVELEERTTWGVMYMEKTRRVAQLEINLERMRQWLDNNTTHYLTNESDGPVLADVSEKIWYHATDDTESYPFTELMDKAIDGERL